MSQTSLEFSTFALLVSRGRFSLGRDRLDRMINVVFEVEPKHKEKEPERDQNKRSRRRRRLERRPEGRRRRRLGGLKTSVTDTKVTAAIIQVRQLHDVDRKQRSSIIITPPPQPLRPLEHVLTFWREKLLPASTRVVQWCLPLFLLLIRSESLSIRPLDQDFRSRRLQGDYRRWAVNQTRTLLRL